MARKTDGCQMQRDIRGASERAMRSVCAWLQRWFPVTAGASNGVPLCPKRQPKHGHNCQGIRHYSLGVNCEAAAACLRYGRAPEKCRVASVPFSFWRGRKCPPEEIQDAAKKSSRVFARLSGGMVGLSDGRETPRQFIQFHVGQAAQFALPFGGDFLLRELRTIGLVRLAEGVFKLGEVAGAHLIGGALDPECVTLESGGSFARIFNLLPGLGEQVRPSQWRRLRKPEVDAEDGAINGVAAFADQPGDAEVSEIRFHVYNLLMVQEGLAQRLPDGFPPEFNRRLSG